MRGWRASFAMGLMLLLLWPSLPATAQEASPFLPMDHWAHEAVRRLDALGLLPPGYDAGSRSLTVDEAGRWLTAAAEEAPAELERLVSTYRARFAEELGHHPVMNGGGVDRPGPAASPVVHSVHGAALLGYAATSGLLEPGTADFELAHWSGPRPRPDVSGIRVRARLGAELVPELAAAGSVAGVGSAIAVDEAYIVTGLRVVGLWAGRRPMGYRTGVGGGLVLDSVRMDGGGVFLRRPVELPVVGPLRLESGLTRVDDNGWIGRPWLWNMRLSLQPHARLGIGATRAIMFGGDRNEPVTLRNVLYMLVGKHGGSGSGFENQVAAVDVRYRPPMPVPVMLRMEWGFDDSAGAWVEQPAFTLAVELARVPGIPELAAGLEHTRIAGEAVGHSIWYRHWWFHDGWVADGTPLAHALGGHGQEWLLRGHADLSEARLRLDGRLFARQRGEYNLFAPDREGWSRGLRVEAEWRVTDNVELIGSALWEEGEADWRQRSGAVGFRWVGGGGRQ